MSSSRAKCGCPPQRGTSSVLNSCPVLSYSPHVVDRPSETLKPNMPFSPFPLLKMEIRAAVLSPFCAYFLSDAGRDLCNEVSLLRGSQEHKGQRHLFILHFFIHYKYAAILSS